MAVPPVVVPASETATGNKVTVKYIHNLTLVFQMPSTKTFSLVAGSVHSIGGTSKSAGVATAAYCTTASHPAATCTATVSSGNYKTTYPYAELHLKTTVHTAGGSSSACRRWC